MLSGMQVSVNKHVRSACKQTGPQRVPHKSRDTKCYLYISIPRKRWLRRLTIFELLAQNIPLCLEKLAHRSHECKVLTDLLNLPALYYPLVRSAYLYFTCCCKDELTANTQDYYTLYPEVTLCIVVCCAVLRSEIEDVKCSLQASERQVDSLKKERDMESIESGRRLASLESKVC